ncbi:MAG: lactate racemase domain-containing protein [Chloroflexota bacterium]|nr:lactate racemase domain-containing protein [Chloroflexota bacterium]
MVIGKGYTDRFLTEQEVEEVFEKGLGEIDVDGKRVVVIMPDGTRSAPVPLCFRLFVELLGGRVDTLDFLIALGTHPSMDEEAICEHFGITPEERREEYAEVGIYNHDWQEGLEEIGVIPAAKSRALSDGLLEQDIVVEINGRLLDYDHIIICGPVFPHEIAGFSGGNKYFFPGVSGPDIIDFTHWLGALIGNVNTIGHQNTPVRRALDEAARFIHVPASCFSMVVKGDEDLAGLYFGTPEASQAEAAKLSARVNVTYVDHTYDTVLAVMPDLYDDIWTAGKGMYKTEPIVADGGKVIIYAPHIDEISYTHGAILDRIGYHVRDYFLARMDEFADVPRMVMAHATHVKGAGTYEEGEERPRVHVALATGVPRERCERVDLGYVDPETIEPREWMGREEEGILVVPRAGEVLYRLKT